MICANYESVVKRIVVFRKTHWEDIIHTYFTNFTKWNQKNRQFPQKAGANFIKYFRKKKNGMKLH